MNIHAIYRFLPSSRRKRMLCFIDRIQPTAETRILDIGGYSETWRDFPIGSKITLLNLPKYAEKPQSPERFEYVYGDGRRLEYTDGEFDIVFSNSVIEHVGGKDQQRAFAAEARRVGKAYWVQTPAKEFPLEPHLLTPFIHWLPAYWIPRLLRFFTVWGWITRPTREQARSFWAEIRPLTGREVRELFPDATILVQRFLGIPKSYIAYRRAREKEKRAALF